jgi:hypothetical protein
MASSRKLRYDRWRRPPLRTYEIGSGLRMTLPLVVAARLGRVAAAAALVLMLAVRPAPALAGDDDAAYTATVPVDASADSPEKARELARRDGERRALAAVVARLTGKPDTPQVAKLDEHAISDMVQSFEVANERMSAVRYLADYTFHFDPAKVKPLLGSAATAAGGAAAGAGGTAAASGGSVLLPVWVDGGKPVLWSDPNPWRAAWRQANAAPHLQVPLGDLDDLRVIDARRAAAGDAAALAAIAQRGGAGAALVALATARREEGRLAGIDITLKRYAGGHLGDAKSRSLDADPGETQSALLQRAVAAVAADLAGGAEEPAADAQAATLAAIVPIDSLKAWIAVRDRLGSVAGVRNVELLSLTQSEAKIAIHYVGGAEALKSALKASDFALAGGEPVWRLERVAAKQP